jgi:hypothetical protein
VATVRTLRDREPVPEGEDLGFERLPDFDCFPKSKKTTRK